MAKVSIATVEKRFKARQEAHQAYLKELAKTDVSGRKFVLFQNGVQIEITRSLNSMPSWNYKKGVQRPRYEYSRARFQDGKLLNRTVTTNRKQAVRGI